MDYQKLAADILKNVGGKENINTAWHCATRVRFKLNDEKKANTRDIENLNGVITVVQSAGQYQVVIGNSVGQVFDQIAEQAGLENKNDAITEDTGKKKI